MPASPAAASLVESGVPASRPPEPLPEPELPPEPLPEPELPPEPLPPELPPEEVVPELPPVPMASVSEPLSETPCCDPVVEPHAAANNHGTRYRARPNRDKATSIMAGKRSTRRTEVQQFETIVGWWNDVVPECASTTHGNRGARLSSELHRKTLVVVVRCPVLFMMRGSMLLQHPGAREMPIFIRAISCSSSASSSVRGGRAGGRLRLVGHGELREQRAPELVVVPLVGLDDVA